MELDFELMRSKARAIRRHVVQMIGAAGSGHPGGSLSCADILAALYFGLMRIDPARPDWPDRDRFILSKGHAAPALYAALAERGFFPVEWLSTLRKLGSPLQGHPDMRKTPGVEASTGSLGQGLSFACGVALAARLDGSDRVTYVLLGDGECEEGQVWEAAMAASHYRLHRLVTFVDHNGLQIDGPITQVCSPEPLAEKWRAFGWDVQQIDGHDVGAICAAVKRALECPEPKPHCIIAETVKGKGVSFMEGQVDWHGKAPNKEQVALALKELAEDGEE